MTRPKAYSYIRMSSDTQIRGDSKRRQLELSERFCRENDLELVEQIEDVGVPAFHGQNVEFGTLGRFLGLIKAGKIEAGSYLLIESLDRLSRQTVADALELFTSIIKNKITVVTLADGQQYTLDRFNNDIGSLFTSLGIMLRAHDESKTKSLRLKAAWDHKRRTADQKVLTKKAPAWVQIDDDRRRFEVIPEAASAIKQIFNWAAAGDGYYAITRRLNKLRIPPIGRSSEWNLSYVQKILSSRQVIGEFQPHRIEGGRRVPDGDPVPGYFPALISEAEFQQVQQRIRQRRQDGGGRKGVATSNLFQKLAVCGLCGSPLNFINKGRPPKGNAYLACRSALQGNRCASRSWKYVHFEESFFSFISELNLNELFDAAQNEEFAALERRAALLIADIQTLEDRIEKNLERWGLAAENIQNLLETEISKQKQQLDQYRVDLEFTEGDIEARRKGKLENAHSNLLLLKTKLSEATSSDDIGRLRTAVAGHLRNLISKISVYYRSTVEPWELGDEHADAGGLTGALRRHLESLGYKTDNDIAAYLTTAGGALEAAKFERYFVVRFKMGTTKYVQPAPTWTTDFKPPKFKQG